MSSTCPSCHGNKSCPRCNGTGNAKKFVTHPDPKRVKESGDVSCPFCNGTGKCVECKGTGRLE